MQLREEPLISREAIAARVAALGAEISSHYAGRELSVVVVLKGAMIFAADLVREISVPITIDYVRAQSYDGNQSTEKVRLSVPPDQSLSGKHVLLIEDILDTGRTTSALIDCVRGMSPASLALCVLLDKPGNRAIRIKADFIGFEIGNEFVVGYGLDYNEKYRELKQIHVLK